MPKQTFFNLSEEKRNTILKAAREEFAIRLYEEASISRIIVKAGIPRGSFYQYFEDKEDLFKFILTEGLVRAFNEFLRLLEKEEGDLFKACDAYFYTIIKVLKQGEYRTLGKNIFLSMNEKMKESVLVPHAEKAPKVDAKKIIKLLDKKLIDLKSEEEITHLVYMIRDVVFPNIAHFLTGCKDESFCKTYYEFQMSIIRKAIYKKIE